MSHAMRHVVIISSLDADAMDDLVRLAHGHFTSKDIPFTMTRCGETELIHHPQPAAPPPAAKTRRRKRR